MPGVGTACDRESYVNWLLFNHRSAVTRHVIHDRNAVYHSECSGNTDSSNVMMQKWIPEAVSRLTRVSLLDPSVTNNKREAHKKACQVRVRLFFVITFMYYTTVYIICCT